MKELNLCEILKGHEGETFYSSFYGKNIKLYSVQNNKILFYSGYADIFDDGSYIKGGECMLFPSKDQRDWNKWIEEHKPKVPKTWSELVLSHKAYICGCGIGVSEVSYDSSYEDYCKLPIEKSALALLKIHQLIEVGYGGNITNEEWDIPSLKFIITIVIGEFKVIIANVVAKSHIAFHTKEQAEEFLKYPENVQLLKDYFIIN